MGKERCQLTQEDDQAGVEEARHFLSTSPPQPCITYCEDAEALQADHCYRVLEGWGQDSSITDSAATVSVGGFG